MMNPTPELYPSREPPLSGNFWRNHAAWPLLGFTVVFGAVQLFGLDEKIALAWSFDGTTGHWLGSGAGDWWAHRLLHDDGRWLVRGIAALALALWAASFFVASWRGLRSRAGFIALGLIVAVAVVGGLKAITNVDCPWDLAGFGGQSPYVPLFGDRPDYLPHARCFPGAHSASGFALLCLYFAWRDSSAVLARAGLAAGLGLGTLFAIGQEARGAHFLSHDLASVAVVWLVQLALYAWLLRPAAARATAGASTAACAPESA